MIKQAEFITSVGNLNQIPHYDIEIAVAGKSNVGKSSFINAICNKKKLAKTSKEPGRTRLLNFFNINNGAYALVDLPGYGYAKVSDEEKLKWGTLIEHYFQVSKGLKSVFMLLDIRHDPTKDDMQMLQYLYFYHIPFTLICTKSDKLSKSAANKRKREIANFIGVGVDDVLTFSSLNKNGLQDIFDRIDSLLSI